MKAQAATFFKKAFRINGETFSDEVEAQMNALADKIIIVGKWSAKIFVVATIFMLIFGESRLIDGAPLSWRVMYEWKHLFNDILHELFAKEYEGGYFKRSGQTISEWAQYHNE